MVKGKNKLRKTILGIAIALLLAFFLGYAVNTFYKQPQYSDYCDEFQRKIINTQTECEAAGGRWNQVDAPKIDNTGSFTCTKVSETTDGRIRMDCYGLESDVYNGYCDQTFECQKEYDTARESKARTSFIILVILGLISIFAGGILIKVEAVGSGIMGGGVLTLLYAAIRFWGDIEDYARLAILGIALAVLIWLGVRKFKD